MFSLYFTKNCFQKLHIWLIPPEGGCVSGCSYPAPVTTHVTINDLTPGQEYQILLKTESNGKNSSWTNLTQVRFQLLIIGLMIYKCLMYPEGSVKESSACKN